MRQGRSIPELVSTVVAQAQSADDFLANTNVIEMTPVGNIFVANKGEYVPTNYAHGQIQERLDIPAKYYNRMRESAPGLLAENANHWFRSAPERRMLRTMVADRQQPTLRAFLSDRYRRLDNIDLMRVVVPFMKEEFGRPLEVVSSEVTETRMYLKVIAPDTERDLNALLAPGGHARVNEPVRAGFVIQNSEVGAGAVAVSPFVDILRCTNGMIVTEFGQRKYHTGKRQGGGGDGDEIEHLLSDDTKRLDDAAFFSKVKDIIRACVTKERVGKLFLRMAETRGMKIEAAPEEAVTRLAKSYSLNEEERDGVLRTLIDSGQGLSLYGLVNGVTEVAKGDKITYDRASELEKLAGDLMSMTPESWRAISAK